MTKFDFSKCKDDDEWWKLYGEYLKSKEWSIKRAKRLKIDGYTCQVCQESDKSKLMAHHKNYNRVGHENIKEDLITLCGACHYAVTKSIRRRRWERKKKEARPQSDKLVDDDMTWGEFFGKLVGVNVPAEY